MLANIKLLLGITDNTKDTLLTYLINSTIDEVKAYCHRSVLDNTLNTAVEMMVVYKYNRIGTEGLSSENYSGVSFNYSDDYPDTIKRLLNSKRKLVIC